MPIFRGVDGYLVYLPTIRIQHQGTEALEVPVLNLDVYLEGVLNMQKKTFRVQGFNNHMK